MTLSHLPAPAGPTDDAPPYETWEGQTAVLAAAGAAGCRAAAWVRSLPAPPFPVPVGAWLAGELPAAIEAAMSGLDPQECDHMAPDGRTAGRLTAPVVSTPERSAPWLLSPWCWRRRDGSPRTSRRASWPSPPPSPGPYGSSRRTRAPRSCTACSPGSAPSWTTPHAGRRRLSPLPVNLDRLPSKLGGFAGYALTGHLDDGPQLFAAGMGRETTCRTCSTWPKERGKAHRPSGSSPSV